MITLTDRDRLDIIELQSIYAWAIDGREPDLFARVFTEDVEAIYPSAEPIRGLAAITEYMDAFHAPLDATHHLIANPWLEAGADAVTFRSYVLATMISAGCPGGDEFSGGGYYVDRVVPTDAGWRISRRDVRNFWRAGNPQVIGLGRDAVAGL
jgi:hypothetical protein